MRPRLEVRLIEWIDSCHRSGWHSEEEAVKEDHGDSLHHSIGFILKEDDDWVTFAQSVTNRTAPDTRNSVDAVMTIPRAAIKRMKALK